MPSVATARPQRPPLQVEALGCVTGDTDVAKRRGCEAVPGARSEDSATGLAGVVGLLAGNERRSLYAVGNRSAVLTRLALLPPRGRISFGTCFTGNSFVTQCTNLPGAQANSIGSPLSHPTAAAISPDGRSLYVASGDFHDATVAHFVRDPLSGGLAYVSCLSGEIAAGPGGTGACATIPGAVKEGYGSGLDEPSGIAISADGTFLYVTAGLDESVSVFTRDTTSGALSFQRCISSNPSAIGCAQMPGRHLLGEAMSPLISVDGKFLYVAAKRPGAINTFAIDGAGGIAYLGCISGDSNSHPCGRKNVFPGGDYTLRSPSDLIEAGGKFIYATSGGAIAVMKRNSLTGKLVPVSCISGYSGDRGKCTLVPRSRRLADGSPLASVRSPLLAGNGRILYVAARGADGITKLGRDPRTGELGFLGCATGNLQLTVARGGVCGRLPGATPSGVNSGFHKTAVLAYGPNGLLYAAAPRDSTVSVLRH